MRRCGVGPEKKIPQHVAIILDGNGRWAKKRGLPRSMGHAEGCRTVEKIVADADSLGIRYLTVYGFSTENWKRDDTEVGALIQLFRYYMVRLLRMAKENNVRVRMIGERSRFDRDIVDGLDRLERETAANTGLVFTIAINYGARDEIVRAARRIASAVRDGKLKEEEITEDLVTSFLDTEGLPDPDLLIRTGGEMRLSNYLLWQCAYTEFYVTDCLWPDFNKAELEKAVAAYQSRDRRFGGV
ncbi:MAG: isoprenyl transferase [Lachnospiraceae bacterium]|nr:isoprenyl transferase [Lachnospiraceae bacterium]